ncbi:MAG: hypothetical protein IT515_01440 [Burkholderiales bacterium]|nr:hypothetical protein [Burkholderiales bacterium]
MLWHPKQPERTRARDPIEPAALPVAFDEGLLRQHLTTLLEAAQADGGVAVYLESLEAKRRLFGGLLAEDAIEALDEAGIEALLGAVFTARRKLFPVLAEMGAASAAAALRELLYGSAPLGTRMHDFVARLPIRDGEGREARARAARLRRAAHDLAAEVLHFADPVRYPLMARWVWDDATTSGALREFVPGAASTSRLALDARPETFEAARRWIAAGVEAQGIYRDVPFWVDLVQAAAYAHYFRAMTGGVLGSDFTRSGGPEESMKKLLGIEPERRGGKSRVKRSTWHADT